MLAMSKRQFKRMMRAQDLKHNEEDEIQEEMSNPQDGKAVKAIKNPQENFAFEPQELAFTLECKVCHQQMPIT